MFSITLVCIFVLWLFCRKEEKDSEKRLEKEHKEFKGHLAQIKGKFGEQLVESILNTLGDEYLVLNDLLIRTSSNKTSQIDHMIISPYGIFVIETKYYRGLICGNKEEEQWSQYLNHGSQKYNFLNPIMQNESHIKVVKNMIINSYGNDLNLPIVSIVTFPKIATLSDYILDNNLAIYYSEIPNFIFNFGKEKKIDINTVKDIYNYFSRLNIVDPVERETHVKLVKSIKGLS